MDTETTEGGVDTARVLAEQEQFKEWNENGGHSCTVPAGLRLSRTAQQLHFWLGYMAGKHRRPAVYPKQANLAQLLGVGVEAVRRATRRLEAAGMVRTTWQAPPSSWTRNRHWRRVYHVHNGGAGQPHQEAKTVGLMRVPIGIGKNVQSTRGASSTSTSGGGRERRRRKREPEVPKFDQTGKPFSKPPRERAKPIPAGVLNRTVELWGELHREHMGYRAHAGPRDYASLKQTLQHHEPDFVLAVMRGILAHKALHSLWDGMEGAIPLHRFLYHFGAYATHWEYLRNVVEPGRWDAGEMVNEAGDMVRKGLVSRCAEMAYGQQGPSGIRRWLREIRERVPIRYGEAIAGDWELLPGLMALFMFAQEHGAVR